nr:TIGR00341 family protein [Candidatus Gracilibacteria bacterium]
MTDNFNTQEIINKNIEIKNDIESIINKKSETWSDKVSLFFDKIEFIKLSPELKQNVAIKVKKDIITGKLYWIEIFLSSMIAALGLLQNSVAVVIGAMLISPLLRPINGLSFSISKGEKHIFWLSFKVLFLSLFISILMGYLSANIIGLSYETNEILARTSPNILDLFIAIFSAMIAVLSLGFTRLGESVAGVAMAASLMPPLAVVGIELSLGNYNSAYGSFMLFIANLVAIILVGIIIFWLYGFTPHIWDRQKASVKTFSFIVIVMFIISIPLFQSLILIREKSELRKESKIYLENILKTENPFISISSLEIDSINDKNVKILSTIKLPEGINFYDTFKRQLDFELSKKLGRNVELNIDLIRTANIVSSDNSGDIKTQMYDFILKEFKNNYVNINVVSLEINVVSDTYNVKVILGINNKENFNSNLFSGLETKIKNKFNEKINFSFIPLTLYSSNKEASLTSIQVEKNQINTDFSDFINKNLQNGISLRSLDVSLVDINSKANVNAIFDVEDGSIGDFNNLLNSIKVFADSKNVGLDIKFFNYKELNFNTIKSSGSGDINTSTGILSN